MKKTLLPFLFCFSFITTGIAQQTVDVTFQFDGFAIVGNVSLRGSWSGFMIDYPMYSPSNDLFSCTITLDASSTYEYRFSVESLPASAPCGNGSIPTHRVVNVGTSNMTVCYQLNTCNLCGVGTSSIAQTPIDLIMNTDGIRLQSTELSQITQLEVFDMLGRTVYSATSGIAVNELIPVALQPNGIYLVRVKANDQTLMYKRIITD